MGLSWAPGQLLAGLGDGGSGLAAWLSPAPGRGPGAAAESLSRALSCPVAAGGSPLFRDSVFSRRYAAGKESAGPGSGGGLEPGTLAALADGSRRVVVTGQQPGFLGGPLLTLHKIATAIALAQLRTAAGLPTTPVFWCGDDDDDLVEALGPVGWDPGSGALVRADGRVGARSGRLERVMIGATEARRWCGPGDALLRRLAERSGADALSGDLSALWTRALTERWDWSRLNVAAVARIFRGQGLVIVRGADPELHAAAAPLYEVIARRRGRCRELAEDRGRQLAAAGEPVALSQRSLRRHLFAAADGRRVPVAEDEALPEAARLRPGVLLRSLVQDWLLHPVAVVIGPGEAAYLRQLEPLYPELGVERSPLVPRMFAWILPRDFPAERLAAYANGPVLDAAAADALAGELAAAAGDRVAAMLRARLGVDEARAGRLALGRARRWRRGVAAMLRAEGAAVRERAYADWPGWIVPDGRRQERRWAAVAAAAYVGDELAQALVSAATAHLAAGAEGDWREYLVR